MFEPAPEPILANTTRWVSDVMLSETALGLCALAVALLGALMLTGRLPVGEWFRVLLGCFVLLGAPVIATELTWGGESEVRGAPQVPNAAAEPPRDLPPANYDPHSGA